jgi:TrmH family RNA methyltransferase
VRRIASRQNPIVGRYRAAARGGSESIMLLDGTHVITDALAAGVRLREAAVGTESERDPEIRELVARLERAGVDTVTVTAPVLSALSPVQSASAAVALADRPDPEAPPRGVDRPVLVAVDVQDPGNVGAMIRVAEAGGAAGVITAGMSADPFGWKALRGAMGSAFRLPVTTTKAADLVAFLRRSGFRVVATSPRGGRSMFEADLTGPVAVLIGGEGAGLAPDLADASDLRVSVPMDGRAESLNAAVTAALIVYEARRQRTVRAHVPAAL